MTTFRATQRISLLMIPMLVLLFAQPNIASAQSNTYTLAKTYSNPFSCTVPQTSFQFPATQAPAPGDCVAVHIAITNDNAAGGVAITNLTLSDNLPTALVGQPGSCSPVVSSGYSCTVSTTNFTFSTNGNSYTLNPGETGSENFVVQVSPSVACGSTISNTAGASATGPGSVTFSGSNATANLTVAACTAPALTAVKSVNVNGVGGGTTASASPGNTLNYRIAVTNNTTSVINGVTVTDVVQAGQSGPVMPTAGLPDFTCTYNATTSVLSCTTPSIAPGATALLLFSTIVGNANTVIPNIASVTSTSGPSTTTNTTAVTVTGAPPIVTSGSLLLCGLVSGYVAATSSSTGTIMVSGVTVQIGVGVMVSTPAGYTLANGAFTCVTFTLNTSGVATALMAQPSSIGTVGLACGVFAPISATSMNVGGLTIAVAPGASFLVGLVPGVGYCFLLNQSGVAFAVLSGIPTSVNLLNRKGYMYRGGYFRPQ